VAGATAYVLKNTNVPPVTKAGIVVGAAATGSLINIGTKVANKLITSKPTLDTTHPESPTSDKIVNEFSPSSPLEYFDIANLFGIDPNNDLLVLIFVIFALSFILTLFLYILTIYLIYIYLFTNKSELNWIDKYLPINYSTKIKSIILNLLKYWNRSNHIIVALTLVLLLIIGISNTYFTYLLFNNFDDFVKVYLKYKNLN